MNHEPSTIPGEIVPLYEYRCVDCGTRFTLLMGVVAEKTDEACPHCGGGGISRLISRFSRVRSEDQVIDSLTDPSKLGDLDNPKELHGFMKRMGSELGDELGDDFDEILDGDMDEAETAGADL
jgi:putative FmdB family regulatory protein